jgi:hypothetical protein
MQCFFPLVFNAIKSECILQKKTDIVNIIYCLLSFLKDKETTRKINFF